MSFRWVTHRSGVDQYSHRTEDQSSSIPKRLQTVCLSEKLQSLLIFWLFATSSASILNSNTVAKHLKHAPPPIFLEELNESAMFA